jgi:predicted transcriptional regulator
LNFPNSWASFYVEADSLDLEMNGTRIDANRLFDGENFRSQLSTEPRAAAEFPLILPGPGVALSIASTHYREDYSFRLKATGVHFLAWHNSTIACLTATCPDSGHSRQLAASAMVPFSAALNPYILVHLQGGEVEGRGTSLVGVAGGSLLDLRTQGTLRLPEADLKGQCPKGPCPNPSGRTFLASGDLTLKGVGPDRDPGRLHAQQLTGAFASASFDESPVSAFRVGAAIAAAGLGLALLGFLVKSLWARLFVRSARPGALKNERRRAVFDTIQHEPGVSFRELQRRLGWAHGTLRNHVQRLLEDKVITAHPHRNTVRYFENHRLFKNRWLPTAHLQDPDTRQLHEWLLAHPGVGQRQVAHETQGWGWTRAKTRRRLADLTEAGLLSVSRQGNRVSYEARQFSWPRTGGWTTTEPASPPAAPPF